MPAQRLVQVINAGLVLISSGLDLTVAGDSDIADFSGNTIGSLQAIWSQTGFTGGSFEVWASDDPDPVTFSPLCGSKVAGDASMRGRLFNIGVIGYRFAFVRFDATGGNATSGATWKVIGVGKRGMYA